VLQSELLKIWLFLGITFNWRSTNSLDMLLFDELFTAIKEYIFVKVISVIFSNFEKW